MEPIIECPICGSKNFSLVKEIQTVTGSAGKSAKIEVEKYWCSDCEEGFYDPDQAHARSEKCREAGILPPRIQA